MTESILNCIGDTSLLELRSVVPANGSRVFLKLESENPTGSMKDRMALAAIERAEADGRLQRGGTVVEYTAGTTGISLAFVCAARGYPIEIVFSDAFSDEKRRTMRALGARITDVPSEGGRINATLIKAMIQAADEISRRPAHWYCDQLNNKDASEGYVPLGEEIWEQTAGHVDAFVHAVSTAHSIHGITRALWRHNRKIRIVAVEPAESAVLGGGPPGPHKIEGVGIGYTPPLWDASLVDEIVAVSTADAKEMTRRIARDEALFAGTSSGANVIASIQVAQRLGPEATVVTLLCDSGLKYLSTDVYCGVR